MCNFNKQNDDTKAFIHLFMKKSADILGGVNFLLNLIETIRETKPNPIILKDKRLKSILIEAMTEKEKENLIYKAVGEGISFFASEFKILEYTSLINETKYIPETFFPSLIQNNIEKKYDLRIFYLNRKFYASAIISQNDNQTTIDFRKYNMEKSNRIIPFKLPDYIEMQLVKLMDLLNYKSGSIDMIYTKEKEYIFLGINPVGQFAQVSEPCNYYLERKVAEYFNNILKV